jgi:hypothetical protein
MIVACGQRSMGCVVYETEIGIRIKVWYHMLSV